MERVEPRTQDMFLTMLDRGLRTEAFEAIKDKVEPEALMALNRLMNLGASAEVFKTRNRHRLTLESCFRIPFKYDGDS